MTEQTSIRAERQANPAEDAQIMRQMLERYVSQNASLGAVVAELEIRLKMKEAVLDAMRADLEALKATKAE